MSFVVQSIGKAQNTFQTCLVFLVRSKLVFEKKVFTNDHKSFTASQANPLVETQNREKWAASYFEQNKMTTTKPRNLTNADNNSKSYHRMLRIFSIIKSNFYQLDFVGDYCILFKK